MPDPTPAIPEPTAEEAAFILERFDQTDHQLQRTIVVAMTMRVAAAESEVARLRARVESLVRDSCEDHTHLQQVCRAAGIPAAKVEGDSHGVPPIGELADLLGARVAELEAGIVAMRLNCEDTESCANCRRATDLLEQP